MRPFRKPDRFRDFDVIAKACPGYGHADRIYDIPKRQIILNRTANEGANVTFVRFAKNGPENDRVSGA